MKAIAEKDFLTNINQKLDLFVAKINQAREEQGMESICDIYFSFGL